MSKKWVYLFTEGNASMRDLLGGKGAGVAEMTRTGVPVPPGFTITTEACNEYYARGRQFPERFRRGGEHGFMMQVGIELLPLLPGSKQYVRTTSYPLLVKRLLWLPKAQ
jgi:phosphoenolpyruvate synthase/pyruvate phosphate dikinase